MKESSQIYAGLVAIAHALLSSFCKGTIVNNPSPKVHTLGKIEKNLIVNKLVVCPLRVPLDRNAFLLR